MEPTPFLVSQNLIFKSYKRLLPSEPEASARSTSECLVYSQINFKHQEDLYPIPLELVDNLHLYRLHLYPLS